MKRILFIAGAAAIVLHFTVFAHADSTKAFVSFAIFWLCAVGYVAAEVVS